MERRVESLPVDALGEAFFEVEDGGPVPDKSVWAVVDLLSGSFAIAAPGTFYLDESPFPGSAFEVVQVTGQIYKP